MGTASSSLVTVFPGKRSVSAPNVEALPAELSPDRIYNDQERPIGSLKIEQSLLDSAATQSVPRQVRYSTEKSERILGVKYRPLEVTIQDTLRSAVAMGWQ